jgi:hypothetical protein
MEERTNWAVQNKLVKPKAFHNIATCDLLQELANVAQIKVVCPEIGITIRAYQPIYTRLAECFDKIAGLNNWDWSPSSESASTVVFRVKE